MIKYVSVTIIIVAAFLVLYSGLCLAESNIYTEEDLKKYNYPVPEQPSVSQPENTLQQNERRQIQRRQTLLRIYTKYENGGNYSYKSINELWKCNDYCPINNKSLDDMLVKGWKVISSRDIERNIGYCRCIGAEYILEIEE